MGPSSCIRPSHLRICKGNKNNGIQGSGLDLLFLTMAVIAYLSMNEEDCKVYAVEVGDGCFEPSGEAPG
jgi:hypothetical protein